MVYLLLISLIISAILISLLGLKSITNYFEVFIIVIIISGIVLKQILKGEKMNLDLLENKTISIVFVFLLCIFFLILE